MKQSFLLGFSLVAFVPIAFVACATDNGVGFAEVNRSSTVRSASQPQVRPVTPYDKIENDYAAYGVSPSSITFPKSELTSTCATVNCSAGFMLVYFRYGDTTNSAIFHYNTKLVGDEPTFYKYTGGGGLAVAVLEALDSSMPATNATSLYNQYESSAF